MYFEKSAYIIFLTSSKSRDFIILNNYIFKLSKLSIIEIEKLKSNITEKLKKSPRIQHSWGYCFL